MPLKVKLVDQPCVTFLKINIMETLFYPGGWGSSNLLSTLLLATLGGENIFTTYPFPELPIKSEELDKMSFEEKQKFYKENLTGYWRAVMDRFENPDPEGEKILNNKLKPINEEISKLTNERQEIIDDWIMAGQSE